MSKVINEDHNGNINMLMIGGDKQYDGKIKVVSPEQSERPLELLVYPKYEPHVTPSAGAGACKSITIDRDFYYSEVFYMHDRELRFYRHSSLTVHEAYIKLFAGYNP